MPDNIGSAGGGAHPPLEGVSRRQAEEQSAAANFSQLLNPANFLKFALDAAELLNKGQDGSSASSVAAEQGVTHLSTAGQADPTKSQPIRVSINQVGSAGSPQLPQPGTVSAATYSELADSVQGKSASGHEFSMHSLLGEPQFLLQIMEDMLEQMKMNREASLKEGLTGAKQVLAIAETAALAAEAIIAVHAAQAEAYMTQMYAAIGQAGAAMGQAAMTAAGPVIAKIKGAVDGAMDKVTEKVKQEASSAWNDVKYQSQKSDLNKMNENPKINEDSADGEALRADRDKLLGKMEVSAAKSGNMDEFKEISAANDSKNFNATYDKGKCVDTMKDLDNAATQREGHDTAVKDGTQGELLNEEALTKEYDSLCKPESENYNKAYDEAYNRENGTVAKGPPATKQEALERADKIYTQENKKYETAQGKISENQAKINKNEEKITQNNEKMNEIKNKDPEGYQDNSKYTNLEEENTKLETENKKFTDENSGHTQFKNNAYNSMRQMNQQMDTIHAKGDNNSEFANYMASREKDLKAVQPGMGQMDSFTTSEEYKKYIEGDDTTTPADKARTDSQTRGKLDNQKALEKKYGAGGDLDQAALKEKNDKQGRMDEIDKKRSGGHYENEAKGKIQQMNGFTKEIVGSGIEAAKDGLLAGIEMKKGKAEALQHMLQELTKTQHSAYEKTHETRSKLNRDFESTLKMLEGFLRAQTEIARTIYGR